MVPIDELMDLHRLERILLGKLGIKNFRIFYTDLLERKGNGMIEGQLAFRPAPPEEIRNQGLRILRKKRNDLRVSITQESTDR